MASEGEATQQVAATVPIGCTNACTSPAETGDAAALDADLQTVVDRWPALPEGLRQAILTLAKSIGR